MTHDEHIARLRECVEAGDKANPDERLSSSGMTVRCPSRGDVAKFLTPQNGGTFAAHHYKEFFLAAANSRSSLAYALERLEKLEAALKTMCDNVERKLPDLVLRGDGMDFAVHNAELYVKSVIENRRKILAGIPLPSEEATS